MTDKVTNRVEQAFWEEDYFGGVRLPSRPDRNVPFERALAAALAEHAPVRAGARVVEIGCAPGTWLVFYAERFGAAVAGVEYSAKGVELTRANLASAGLEGDIVHADFLTAEPVPADLCLSLGFIEHFDDLDALFARHVRYVAPGGRLVIGVPNYRGLNEVVQRYADPAHLAMHNRAAMVPALYRRLAAEHGLRVDFLRHIGGFDPVIIKLGRPPAGLWTRVEGLWRRLRVADWVNHPWLSSYLLAVLGRPPATL